MGHPTQLVFGGPYPHQEMVESKAQPLSQLFMEVKMTLAHSFGRVDCLNRGSWRTKQFRGVGTYRERKTKWPRELLKEAALEGSVFFAAHS